MNKIAEIRPAGALTNIQGQGRMAVSDMIQHISTVQEVMRAVMKPDVHYGTIPGTPKPTLYKAGAEVLCMVFRIADNYEITDLSTADVVRYRVNCIGRHQINDVVLGSGLGEASSGEEKYKWRKAICKEEFDETPANMRRVKHSRGKGGTTYKQDQIRTEPADLANTILKMANKRAKMAMVLNVTAASDCFSQDLEDMDAALVDHLTRHEGDAPANQGATAGKTLPPCPDDKFSKSLPNWEKNVAEGGNVNDLLAMLQSKYTLSTDQFSAIAALERAKPHQMEEAAKQTDDEFTKALGD